MTYSLIMIMAFGTIIINLSIVSKFIDQSQQLVQKKQMDQHLKSVSYLAQLQVRSFIERSEKKLFMGNKLLSFIQKQDINTQDPIQCLNKYVDEYAPQDTFCYGIFWNETEPREEMQKQFLQLTTILSASLLILDNDFGFSVTALTKNELYSINPGTVMENYRPSIRSWYKNHLNSINISNSPLYKSYYSEPYIHYITKSTFISQTMSLYNQNYTVFGISSCQLDFQLVLPPEFFTKIDALGFIFTINGTLLIGDKQYENVTYLKDTDLFNDIDQSIILDVVKGIKYDNNCTTVNTDLLCLKNRSSQEELVLSVSLLQEGELVLAIVMNHEKDVEQLMKYNQQVQKRFNQLSLQVIIYSTYLLLACLGLAIVMLLAIQYSIKNVIDQTNFQIYKITIIADSIKYKEYMNQKIRTRTQLDQGFLIKLSQNQIMRLKDLVKVLPEILVRKIQHANQYSS